MCLLVAMIKMFIDDLMKLYYKYDASFCPDESCMINSRE